FSFQAQVAANEAATQQELARNEISKGIADRERQQRQAARAMGEMRANMGASGFEMDSGSNESLLAESAQEHQYDSQVIMSNANQAAWQHLVAANSAGNQQGFAQWQGSQADSGRGANGLAMAGTLLGGIGTGIGQYNSYLQNKSSGSKNGYYDPALQKMVSQPVRH
uniref:virion core protein, T7 gp14 family n=1 Tax=uncultured Desulfovibrio sp. TaxID=167968 RepID=UPI00263AFC2B